MRIPSTICAAQSHQAVIRRDGLHSAALMISVLILSPPPRSLLPVEACAAEASNAKLVDADQRFTRAVDSRSSHRARSSGSPSASMITLISASADGCAVVCGAMAAMVPEVGA